MQYVNMFSYEKGNKHMCISCYIHVSLFLNLKCFKHFWLFKKQFNWNCIWFVVGFLTRRQNFWRETIISIHVWNLVLYDIFLSLLSFKIYLIESLCVLRIKTFNQINKRIFIVQSNGSKWEEEITIIVQSDTNQVVSLFKSKSTKNNNN